MRRTPTVLLSLGAAGAVLVGCGSSGSSGGTASGTNADSGGKKQTVNVELTNKGCSPDTASVTAGATEFKVTNKSAAAVSEAELLNGSTILGESENVAPGLSGSFSLNLKAGKYQLYCPGGSGPEKVDFAVAGSAAPSTANAADATRLEAATDGYATYVKAQVADLVTGTEAFAAAVKAGDIAKAKSLYAAPRENYERIEPVAESFGDLDPALDARIADVEAGTTWTGFHRLEKALYKDNSLAGMNPIADGLVTNVTKLQTLVATTTYQPAQLANGATELLNEVGQSKITGEEEAYSHLDLVDFQGNVQGAEKAFSLLEPVVKAHQPALASTVATRFADMDAALKPYRKGDTFVDYSTVTTAQRRVLSQKVDALAEPLSQVAGVVVG